MAISEIVPPLAQLTCNAIRELTSEECSSLTIFAPNADFDGPDQAIDWISGIDAYPIRFTGESLIDTLNEAVELKKFYDDLPF